MMRHIDERLWHLQWKLLYSVLVAGKTATFADLKVEALLTEGLLEYPFDVIRNHINDGTLSDWLRDIRTGSYTKLSKCFPALVQLNPVDCTIGDLESVHGIGPKTARFFLLWTRPDSRYAALDTHVLKWLKSLGYDAPKTTPSSGRQYEQLEAVFLAEADKRMKTPRELDFEVWQSYSNYQT